ncbi:MAG: glyoxalase superfamily protein [Leeuwenhoekiella sp.]
MALNKNGYLAQITPVLVVNQVLESLEFYVQKLGFDIVFIDNEKNPSYSVLRRNNIAIHLKLKNPDFIETQKTIIRVEVQGINDLFEEYKLKGVFNNHTALEEKPWGTVEFALYDPSQNQLVFYHIQ